MPEANLLQILLFGLALVAACSAISWLARRHWHQRQKRDAERREREDLEEALAALLEARLTYLRSLARAESLESEARSQRIRSEEAFLRIDRLKAYLSREAQQHVGDVLEGHGLDEKAGKAAA